MKPLVKYELCKLLRRRSTWAVMAVSLLVTVLLCGVMPVIQFQTYREEGVLRGLEGISYEKERYAELSGPLTDEAVAETVLDYQALFADPDNVGYDGNERYLIGDAYWTFEAYRGDLLSLISANYDAPGEVSGYNNSLPELDLSEVPGFYQRREEKVEELLDSASYDMTEEQKSFWRELNSRVEEPFTYGYHRGWTEIISCFELLLFPILAICIVVAPVFSGEYQAGTADVILSGRFGRTKLVRAKIAASLLFGGLAFLLHVAAAWAVPLAAFGVDGWDLPVQITNTVIPYPFTFLQAALASLGVTFLVTLTMVALTLLLSSRMSSPYLVLIVVVPVLFLPMFLSPSGTTGAYNLILLLLPYQAAIPRYGQYISYQIGGLVLDAFTARAAVYALLTAVLLPLSGRGFRNDQALEKTVFMRSRTLSDGASNNPGKSI